MISDTVDTVWINCHPATLRVFPDSNHAHRACTILSQQFPVETGSDLRERDGEKLITKANLV